MKTKIVTAYWMDVNGFPFQGCQDIRKPRYLGSLISHCKGINLPVVCYTHQKNINELTQLKDEFNLDNLEIKLLELSDTKYHKQICSVRNQNFNTDLDGRGPEIMWGKFEVLEKEINSADNIYWVDVGLQHPGIFPWRYSKRYNKEKKELDIPTHWWADYDSHNFSSLFNTDIFNKLNIICKNKIALLTSYNPQISYPFNSLNITNYALQEPYPVGGMVGGSTTILKKYINYFWEFAELILKHNTLCTEEAIMKVAFDKMDKQDIISFSFSAFASGEHDDFHFNMWSKESNNLKPFYMMWYDILNYTT